MYNQDKIESAHHPLLVFGDGKVGISINGIFIDELPYYSLTFSKLEKPAPIGKKVADEDKSTPIISFVFKNLESLETLQRRLELTKIFMEENDCVLPITNSN
ncbi:hypothetical protein [Tepidanaerobacter acetatoxydans]|uniref:hypothetical protein n=1 Tax=Tepidanaerobacter acetatoxydans TaxID=499229 RepID=UPI001BD6B909|nr:hypothetical protein [Tepidanaerobacter acetatoxydans]